MQPNKITIHCSDSPNGRAVSTGEIRKWHTDPPPKGRGWQDIGYHAVIELDGGVGKGRETSRVGAHVEGHNEGNLGLCFVGTDKFTLAQFGSAKLVLKNWMLSFGIGPENVFGHYQFDTAIRQGKKCPNMKVEAIREWLTSDADRIQEYLLEGINAFKSYNG